MDVGSGGHSLCVIGDVTKIIHQQKRVLIKRLLSWWYKLSYQFHIHFSKVGESFLSNQDKGQKGHFLHTKKTINNGLKNCLWMILHATSTASLIKIKDLHYANNTSFKNHIYRIFVEKRAAPLAPWATKVVLCKQSCYSVSWRLRRFYHWHKSKKFMFDQGWKN